MAARSGIAQAEVKAAEAVASARHAPLVRGLGLLSEAADQPPLIALCASVLVAGLVRRDARLADAGGAMLAAELLATGLKDAVKANVDRTRPHVVADGGAHRLEPGHSDASALNSFPSGHTAGAVAVARAIARKAPRYAPAAYAAAAAIAAIQIPRCRHYPSDLAAGAAIGLVAEAVTAGLERAVAAAAAPGVSADRSAARRR